MFPLIDLADGSCDGVQCHDNATCFKPLPEKLGVCACEDGWRGDGRTCYGQKTKTFPFSPTIINDFQITTGRMTMFFTIQADHLNTF